MKLSSLRVTPNSTTQSIKVEDGEALEEVEEVLEQAMKYSLWI